MKVDPEIPKHEHIWILGHDDCVVCGRLWSDIYQIVYTPEDTDG